MLHAEDTNTLVLPVVSPFRLDLTAWVLRRRERNKMDMWANRSYSRILVMQDVPVRLTVTQAGEVGHPELKVNLQSRGPLLPGLQVQARAIVQKILGLNIDVRPFYEITSHDLRLERLAELCRGVRPPRFPTVFEALVNAIACQQVSLDVGILLLNRLSLMYGIEFYDGESRINAFPRPEDLLDVPESELKQLGFSHQKARTIKEVVQRVADGELDQEQLERATNEEVLKALQSIRGIGRWSAEYVLLRGLGRLDVFPGDDVGAQNNVQTLLGLSSRPSYERLKDITAGWKPYAGFIYFHLLLGKLHDKGFV